jgi:hypothetical protein
MIPCPQGGGWVYATRMGVLLNLRALTLLQAIAFAWPASQTALYLHTPQPIPPVDDDDDEDDDKGRGSGGGNIDPDDDEGGEDDDEDDDDEDTLWTVPRVNK